jgi:hypothetical protein
VVAVQGEAVHAVHLVLEGQLDVRCYQGLGRQQGRQQGPDVGASELLVVDERDLEQLRYRWAAGAARARPGLQHSSGATAARSAHCSAQPPLEAGAGDPLPEYYTHARPPRCRSALGLVNAGGRVGWSSCLAGATWPATLVCREGAQVLRCGSAPPLAPLALALGTAWLSVTDGRKTSHCLHIEPLVPYVVWFPAACVGMQQLHANACC